MSPGRMRWSRTRHDKLTRANRGNTWGEREEEPCALQWAGASAQRCWKPIRSRWEVQREGETAGMGKTPGSQIQNMLQMSWSIRSTPWWAWGKRICAARSQAPAPRQREQGQAAVPCAAHWRVCWGAGRRGSPPAVQKFWPGPWTAFPPGGAPAESELQCGKLRF